MIAIVCGGRDYTDSARVSKILDAAVNRLGLDTIIEGECPTDVNADKLARDWAEARGDVAVIRCPAETVRGKFQGPARNQLMLVILTRGERGDLGLFAFPSDGPGTAHMLKIAKAWNKTADDEKQIRIFEL